MKKMSAIAVAMGLALLFPAGAESQQDPVLVGQGAQVYSTTCGRCHNARPGSERTDREWMAIVAHMRARANLSKSSAAAVLAFLQATNVPESAPASPPMPQAAPPKPAPPTATPDTLRSNPPPQRDEG